MAADRYLTIVGTQQTLKSATDVSTGAGDAGKIVALGAAGTVDLSVLPTGIGETVKSYVASEAIAAGAVVSVTSAGQIQNADAATQRAAIGFALVAIANAATGNVFLSGQITGLSSLTPGTKMFLGAAGAATATAPTAAGSIWQPIGRASSANAIEFQPHDPVLLA